MHPTSTILCFYHSPCNDGAGAAAALRYRMGQAGALDGKEIRFCPLNYTTGWGEPLPDAYIENEVIPDHPVDSIYILDITFSKIKYEQILEALRTKGKVEGEKPRTISIDHHKTALEKIDELREFCDETYIKEGSGLSGATLVWNYFNEKLGELPTPELLRYIADQDIWEWKLPNSRDVNAALNVLSGKEEELYEELQKSLKDEKEWKSQRQFQGAAINAMVDAQVKKAAWHAVEIQAGETTLHVLNSASFSSELGNYICQEAKEAPNVIALVYSIQDNWHVRVSARSITGGKTSARNFAERFGGGGHDNAAGCRFDSLEEFQKALDLVVKEGL